MHDALIFTDVITVVIYADKIAVFVERKFINIAQARRKNFEITAISFTAHNYSLIRVMPASTILIGNAGADITHAVIHHPVWPQCSTGKPVPTETNVHTVTLRQGRLCIHVTI